ncbi:MAG: carboxypeptidase-like regulatory domain-containing protein [Bacteroidia bacterium]|nr:carboxypeptidase-like regulatory domain-containing protein [Bacteroidia bacterium]
MKLSIHTPCSESFDKFEPTKAGGFCQNCQKEVIDFTSMTDAEVLRYFKEKQGKTCGYFTPSQLKSYPSITESHSRWSPGWIGASLLGISLFTFFPITNTHAQSNNVPQAIDLTYLEMAKVQRPTKTSDTFRVRGVVVDESDEPMPGASVLVKGTTNGVFTDVDGKFILEGVSKTDVLIFSYVGYEREEYNIKKNQSDIQEYVLDVKMEMDHLAIMGEVAVAQIYSSKKTIWQKLSGLFK